MEMGRSIGRRLFFYIFLGCILPYSLGMLYVMNMVRIQTEEAYVQTIDSDLDKIHTLLYEGIQEPVGEEMERFCRADQTLRLVEAVGDKFIADERQLPEDNLRYLRDHYRFHDSKVSSLIIATEKGGYCSFPRFIAGRENDPRTGLWYRQAKLQAEPGERMEPRLVKLYKDPAVVYTRVLRKDEKIIGAVAMELNLQRLQQELAKIRTASGAYLMVLNQDDIIVVNPLDPEWVMKTPRELLLTELAGLREKPAGLYPIDLAGIRYQMKMKVSDKTGWAVVAFLDPENIGRQYQRLLYNMLPFGGMGIVLFFCVAVIAARRITRPIEKLSQGALAITSGDLNARVDIDDRDEFGFLARSLNKMVGTLRGNFAKIKKQTEEIQKREQEFQTLVENAQDIISRLDKSLRYLYINPAIEPYIGVKARDFINRTNQEIGFSTEFCFLLEECHRKVFRTGKDRLLELDFPGQDGNSVYFQAHIIPEFDQYGRVETVLSVMRNITERKEMEKHLARLDRLNLVGEMAAGIAHEVRNPMTTVRGYLQVLGRRSELAVYQDQFQLMIDELDRANGIISEFLALAKNKRVDLQMMNLNTIVRSLQPLIQADASLADKLTEWDLNEVPLIYMDEKEIRQLILNLARNGLEAMNAGGCLTLSTGVKNEDVILTIKDQGGGIHPEILDKIGMPFMTTKDNGTGLGLAMCYSIASRHHAEIDIQTGDGGTVIAVRFRHQQTKKHGS